MKFKTLVAVALATLAITSCDDTTDTFGNSLIDNKDALDITNASFKALSRSIAVDSVLAHSSNGYLGKVRDPETGAYVTGDYMLEFSTLADPGFLAEDTVVTKTKSGRAKPYLTTLNLFFTKFYGDSTNSMKLKVYELDKPLPEGHKYYSNFDPIKSGYIRKDGYTQETTWSAKDNSLSDSVRTSNGTIHSITLHLDKPYTAKDGKTYEDLGAYLAQMYYDHPEYYATPYKFLHQVFAGFYVQTIGGLGTMADITTSWINMRQLFMSDSTKMVKDAYVTGTDEVLQTNHITTDAGSVKRMVDDNSCTYVKSPAGIFTEITLPVDDIKQSHTNYTLNTVKIEMQRINNEKADKYTLPVPTNLLLIPKDSIKTFFESHDLPNNKTSYYATYNSTTNSYTFNNISNMVNDMYANKGKSADYNKAVLVPITLKTTKSSNGTVTLNGVSNNMGLSSTRLVGGPNTPIEVSVIYSRFKK